jgi:hypothetical protein
MSAPAVAGDFLGPAGKHIAAAVSFRSELPYTAQRGAIRQLDRLVATLGRYLADLCDDPGFSAGRERYAGTPVISARLALGRAAHNLHPAAAAAADTNAGGTHPAVTHLSAAADHLAAGRDLLNSHFTTGTDGTRTGTSYWASVITDGPVASALLGELADCLQQLAPWGHQAIQDLAGEPGQAHLGAPGTVRRRTVAPPGRHSHSRRAASPLPAARPQPAARHPGQRPATAPPTRHQRTSARTVRTHPAHRRTAGHQPAARSHGAATP